MSKIILLNGASSSGKTSLAQAIQYKSTEPWLHLGVDTLLDMMPQKYLPGGAKAEEGVNFIPEKNTQEPLTHIEAGLWGKKVFDCLGLIAKVFARQGHNVILDDVMLGEDNLKSYQVALQGIPVYFVGVFCDLPALQEREILRANRTLGLAKGHAHKVHPDIHHYDIRVDTTSESSFALADNILHFIATHPNPEGLWKS